ncbi:3D domain-containing protein [Paenibacillus hamazuiensis]|uniref:3D domain-containing protein n=1 Tax=Paenibacillus hamazuiensis TaxID=2936508 RepID=UPI00200D531C|nr:3D domain-containing protein [Paenibacillus hamazuiensis]
MKMYVRFAKNAIAASLLLLVSLIIPLRADAYPIVGDNLEYIPTTYMMYAATSIAAEAELAAGYPEEPAQPAALTYEISPGDTLYKIARDFNVSIAALTELNGIRDARGLQIGQAIRIPSINVGLPADEVPVISKVLTTTLTAYTAGVESTGKSPSHPQYGITYSGSRAEEGRTIAVDPAVIPIGATVYIDGIGIRKAEDTGSAVRGQRIDVFMNDVKEARQFGVKKNVKVFVLANA